MSDLQVRTTPRFERMYRALFKRRRGLAGLHPELLRLLQEDPYNQTRSHPIRKLTAVKPG